jgi:hypothetical protein
VRRPPSLIGKPHAGGYICEEWELRISNRCVREDLRREPEASFEELFSSVEIVKALVRERRTRTHGQRQVAPLTCGCEVWVLARGHDHRGATWYDAANEVVWLLAYGRHRSGEPDDFFPYCKELDAKGLLLPTTADLARLKRERDRRLIFAICIEAPLLLLKAQEEGPQRAVLGGEYGVAVEVEIADDLQGTTIAFDAGTLDFGHLEVILSAFHADAEWAPVDAMPSRPLARNEIAFFHTHERSA